MKTREDWGKFFRYAGTSFWLLPLGIFILIFGIISAANPLSGYLETEGRVQEVVRYEEDGKEGYEVFFSFTAGGKVYEDSFTFGPYDYEPGDPVKVYYNAKDPTETSPRVGSPFWGWILIGFRLLLCAYGFFVCRKAYRRIQEEHKAVEETPGEPGKNNE